MTILIECCCEDELNKCRIKAVKAKCIGMYIMGLDPMGDASKLLKYDKNTLIQHISLLMKKTDEEIDAELELAKSSYVAPIPVVPEVEPEKIHYYNLYNALYDILPAPVVEEPVVPVEEPVVEPVVLPVEEPVVPVEEPVVPDAVEEPVDNIVV
jgi:hypothetical protein